MPDLVVTHGEATPGPRSQPDSVATGNDYFGARYDAGSIGRFMTPDPLAGHLVNPQSLNKYVYAEDNPTTLTDPTGLDIWLKCTKGPNCHGGYVGTWDKAHKHFTRTHLSGDQTGSAALGPNGIKVKYHGGTYQGVWDTRKGEGNPVLVSGAGALNNFVAMVNGACRNNSCQAAFVLGNRGSTLQNFHKASSLAVLNALTGRGSGYVRQYGLDFADSWHVIGSHPGAINFRGYSQDWPHGRASTHIPWYPAGKWNGAGHVDAPFPYDDLVDVFTHAASLIRSKLPH